MPPNRLAGSSSAYLRQHEDNPVQWWPWGPDALAQSKLLGRPILLSVGYAACHWCHVMAHESFEDPEVATYINDHFLAIKVDREERPDVDALYMAATQLMTGSGGWPMTVFLLPDARPFFAGTYFPPEDRHGLPGFARLLRALADAWKHQRDQVLAQADELERALARDIALVDHLAPRDEALDLRGARARLREELLSRLDVHGGFARAPKFPRSSYVDALMDFDDPLSIEAVTRTLDAMARGGLYDHVGAGFARYSVDDQWHVPHFEKMLNDQALLARTYLRASKVYRRDDWRAVGLDTLRFVIDELRVPNGFASSLDADAAGVEGSHVTWTTDEVASTLLEAGLESDIAPALARWRITTPGEFEGRSIPRLAANEPFATPPTLRAARDTLRRARARRPQPTRDEKVILEWNAMFASACLQSDDDDLIERGRALLVSLRTSHFAGTTWWRTEQLTAHASASDVAWLLDAHLDAFELDGRQTWLDESSLLASYLITHYWDGDIASRLHPHAGQGFFAQSDLVRDMPARTKEIFDGATPSSHAVTCRALARLALVLGDDGLLFVAQRLVELGAPLIADQPNAVPDLLSAAGFALEGIEVVIPGAANQLSDHVRLNPMASTVLITGSNSSPLLAGRDPGVAYVCRAGICLWPATTTIELEARLSSVSD